jgi:hypothetical protein
VGGAGERPEGWEVVLSLFGMMMDGVLTRELQSTGIILFNNNNSLERSITVAIGGD